MCQPLSLLLCLGDIQRSWSADVFGSLVYHVHRQWKDGNQEEYKAGRVGG